MTARDDTTPSHPPEEVRAAKDAVRRRVTAARRALPDGVRDARARALAAGAAAVAAHHRKPICAYLPFGTEPGSVSMLDALGAAGHEVLLPVIATDDGPLDWARYHPDELADGPLGIRQPTGVRLGPDAIAGAGLVLLPGLAADRRGTRLGRGRGHYDRTLAMAAADTRLVVVLNDEELVDEVPAEAHDRRVHAALLPHAGVVRLGNTS